MNCLNLKIYCDDLSSLSFGILFCNIVLCQGLGQCFTCLTLRDQLDARQTHSLRVEEMQLAYHLVDFLGANPRKTSNKFVAQGRPALYFS